MPLISHVFTGGEGACAPCTRCGAPKRKHRTPRKLTEIAKRKRNERRQKEREAAGKTPREKKPKPPRHIIGVDGEGHDVCEKCRKPWGGKKTCRFCGHDGHPAHVYTLICAVNEDGVVVAEAENPKGLTTAECAAMLLTLPKNALKFVFMGSYDWTKIIEGLTPLDRFIIMRPDVRRRRRCLRCRKMWRKGKECPRCHSLETKENTVMHTIDGIGYDWFNGSFTVAGDASGFGKRRGWGRSTKVWDCFRFFGSSFVSAITTWHVATPGYEWFQKCAEHGNQGKLLKCDECRKKTFPMTAQIERIAGMKAKRGGFQHEDPEEVRKYCREECHLLALLMRAVIKAHEDAEIRLARFDGAGSTASALLKKHGVKQYKGPNLDTLPKGLQFAVMAAFFGGRFENSIVGAITRPVYNRDIYSAYPYAQTSLPCLACGKWRKADKKFLRGDIKGADLAVVHFRVKSLSENEREKMPWAPLPFRDEKGSICYPTGFTGWAWKPEIEAAMRGWPGLIEILDAWVYRTDCEHDPWGWIPDAYRKRIEWGKDGAGLVMKLGINAGYGKTAQDVGDDPPFRSWIWAGMTTATTRAQLLDAICRSRDRWNVLAVATDGLFTTEALRLAEPRNTGTFDLEKPLGGWGQDIHERGVFFVKPGMYFDDSKSLMKARGIGRKELDLAAKRVVQAFKKWDRKSPCKVSVKSRRFFGAKSSVLAYSQCGNCGGGWPGLPDAGCPKCGEPGTSMKVTEMTLPDRKTSAYGRWAERNFDIEFACLPKRESMSKGGTFARMRIRDVGGAASLPYKSGFTSPEGQAARQATEEALEEPDWRD